MNFTSHFPSSSTSSYKSLASPTTQQTISNNYARPFTSGSSVTTFTSLRSASPADRDLDTQRRLLGEEAFGSPDDLPATPSPLFHQTSPLSVASHLQDEYEQELLDPFVVNLASPDRTAASLLLHPAATTLPVIYEPIVPKSPRRKHQHHRLPSYPQSNVPTLVMTHASPIPDSSCLGLNLTEGHDNHTAIRTQSDPMTKPTISNDDIVRSSLRNRATTSPTPLPTIEEVATSRNRIDTPKPSPRPITRATLFPLGPLPEPLPPRKPRYEPPPHIVDIAYERMRENGIPTPTLLTPEQSPSIRAISPLPLADMEPLAPTQSRRSWFSIKKHHEESEGKVEDEKQTQWQIWEQERLRAVEMTKAAAKDNRPEWGGIVEEEKPVVQKQKKSKRFWCFGSTGEMEVEDVLFLTTNEKKGRVSFR